MTGGSTRFQYRKIPASQKHSTTGYQRNALNWRYEDAFRFNSLSMPGRTSTIRVMGVNSLKASAFFWILTTLPCSLLAQLSDADVDLFTVTKAAAEKGNDR